MKHKHIYLSGAVSFLQKSERTYLEDPFEINEHHMINKRVNSTIVSNVCRPGAICVHSRLATPVQSELSMQRWSIACSDG